MKFKKFLRIMEDIILKYPDIDLKTLKIVIDEFYYCLSDTQKDLYYFDYELIKNKHTFQKSLDQILSDIKIQKLQTDIDLFKKSI